MSPLHVHCKWTDWIFWPNLWTCCLATYSNPPSPGSGTDVPKATKEMAVMLSSTLATLGRPKPKRTLLSGVRNIKTRDSSKLIVETQRPLIVQILTKAASGFAREKPEPDSYRGLGRVTFLVKPAFKLEVRGLAAPWRSHSLYCAKANRQSTHPKSSARSPMMISDSEAS